MPDGRVLQWCGLPVAIFLHPDSYAGHPRDIARLRGRSGWLRVAQARLDTYVASHEAVLCAACDEDGEPLTAWQTARLFEMDAAMPREILLDPPDELDEIVDALFHDFLGRCDRETLYSLEREEAKERWMISLVEARASSLLGRADRVIDGLARARRRGAAGGADGSCHAARISRLEERQERLALALRDWRRWRRNRFGQVEADHLDSLGLQGEVEELYTVWWNVVSTRRPMELRLPLQQPELRNPGFDVNSEESRRAAGAEASAYRERREALARPGSTQVPPPRVTAPAPVAAVAAPRANESASASSTQLEAREIDWRKLPLKNPIRMRAEAEDAQIRDAWREAERAAPAVLEQPAPIAPQAPRAPACPDQPAECEERLAPEGTALVAAPKEQEALKGEESSEEWVASAEAELAQEHRRKQGEEEGMRRITIGERWKAWLNDRRRN